MTVFLIPVDAMTHTNAQAGQTLAISLNKHPKAGRAMRTVRDLFFKSVPVVPTKKEKWNRYSDAAIQMPSEGTVGLIELDTDVRLKLDYLFKKETKSIAVKHNLDYIVLPELRHVRGLSFQDEGKSTLTGVAGTECDQVIRALEADFGGALTYNSVADSTDSSKVVVHSLAAFKAFAIKVPAQLVVKFLKSVRRVSGAVAVLAETLNVSVGWIQSGGGQSTWEEEKPDRSLCKTEGEGVAIGIVDTGVDISMPGIGSKWTRKEIVFAEANEHGEVSIANPRESDLVTHHGTRVCSLAAGLAPKANLVVALGLPKGEANALQVVAAMNWAVSEQKVDILNLSLGFKRHSTSRAFDALLQRASICNPNVVIVASTGNDGEGEVAIPSAYDEVLSIGAMDKSAKFWRKTGHSRADNRDHFDPMIVTRGTCGVLVGTSFAAPRIAGIIAANHMHKAGSVFEELRKISETVWVGTGKHRGQTLFCRL